MTDLPDTNPIRFDGQVVVVTGAGRGLGASYAHLIGSRGGTVAVHDAGVAADGSGFDPTFANAVAAEIVAAGGRAAACHENLEAQGAGRRVIEFALDRFGRIDAVIHNAGLVVFASLEETDDATWNRMLAINADAGFDLARAAMPQMRRQGYGRIVLTTSGRAMRREDCVPGLAAYTTAKMAQVGLMVGLAAEVGDADIRINAISPVAATRVLRRHAPELVPELVAPAVALLASKACRVNGAVLSAVGGRFSLAQWTDGPELDLGKTVTPEDVAASWRHLLG